ncbi:hypothetical protein FWC63_01560 [Candidatus Saccharibacteria bacterium]|nr:hypothetical protein [Candidatus Saccharibacteria bacterium]
MFTANFTGQATTQFSNQFTTNIVISCAQGRPAGFTADLVFDNTLNVTVANRTGVTFNANTGRIVMESDGVNNNTSVATLTVRNRSLADGQSGQIRLTNVRGACIDASHNVTSHNMTTTPTRTARFQRPVQQPQPPQDDSEDDGPSEELLAIAREIGVSHEEILRLATKFEMSPVRLLEIARELGLINRVHSLEEQLNVLESQLQEFQDGEMSGERNEGEREGIFRLLDNRWAFFGVGAFMATLIAAAIAIIKSLVKGSREEAN